MESDSSTTSDDTIVAASARPRVVERYWEYAPPFDAKTVVERMLGSIPPRYTRGLKEVVLTNKNGLPQT